MKQMFIWAGNLHFLLDTKDDLCRYYIISKPDTEGPIHSYAPYESDIRL